jgi:hypothetical protein
MKNYVYDLLLIYYLCAHISCAYVHSYLIAIHKNGGLHSEVPYTLRD